MKKKILFYSDHFGGPTTTFIYNDLVGLAKNNEVKYLCTSVNKNSGFVYDHIEVVPYQIDPVRKKIRWILEKKGLFLAFYSKDFSQKINEIILKFNPDIIQCNFGYEALRLTDNLNEQNKKIPMVINFLGYDASFHLKRQSYVRKLKSLAQRKNVYATCNTHFLKQNLRDKGIIFGVNKVIYTGIRQEYFKRDQNWPAPDNKFIFLQIATLALRKGQEVTIKAFKKFLSTVTDPEKYLLYLAGGAEDNYGIWLRKLPLELGMEEKVKFFDWITPEEAKGLMQGASCFVHHSRTIEGRTEGIPTAISEAMSMELPVISTWHAGIPELVEDGVNGYLVQENDMETYATRMKDVVTWSIKPENREKVIRSFTIENRIKIFEDFYEQILNEKKYSV